MPDTLVSLTSPTEPTTKARCAKGRNSRKAARPAAAARPSDTIDALASAGTADALRHFIFGEADQIEIGTRRAKTSFDLAIEAVDDVSNLDSGAKDDWVKELSARLYLLLGIVGKEIDAAHERAEKIADAARELKRPAQMQPFGTGEDLIALRLQLQAAEDALNAVDYDEPPLAIAYHEANDRFIEAPTRTPSDVLLKLERLADLSEMQNDPDISTNRIVLNLIRDLRGALGINGQVQ